MADLPHDLPKLLRAEGLKVTALPGWRRRGRPAYTGGFDPVGVLCHHTATTVTWTIAAVLRLLTGGRTGLPGPLAQLGLSRNGRVFIIAAGRANHAGTAKSSGTVSRGDGNRLYIGIEAFNNGRGEPWPAVQYDAFVLLSAALCKHVTGNSYLTVNGHKETSTTGKIDPTFSMGAFRGRVRIVLDRITSPSRPAPPPVHQEDTMSKLGPENWDAADWKAIHEKYDPLGLMMNNLPGEKGQDRFEGMRFRQAIKGIFRKVENIEAQLGEDAEGN